jgi:hypothetical protein
VWSSLKVPVKELREECVLQAHTRLTKRVRFRQSVRLSVRSRYLASNQISKKFLVIKCVKQLNCISPCIIQVVRVLKPSTQSALFQVLLQDSRRTPIKVPKRARIKRPFWFQEGSSCSDKGLRRAVSHR